MNPIELTHDNKGKVLIVDDDDLIRKILAKYLADKEYNVDTANNGQQAMAMLNENDYELVLTDLRMPQMGGRELLQLMSEQFPDIPKIVLTGYGTNDDIILALKTGAYDFLTKPIIDFTILDYAIDRAIEKKRLNDESKRLIIQLEQINKIISMLNEGKSTGDIFNSLNQALRRIIPFNMMLLVLFHRDENESTVKIAGTDNNIFLRGDIFPIDSVLFDSLIQDKTIVNSDNINEYNINNPGSLCLETLVENGIISLLILPLVISDELRGFLLFGSDIKSAFKQFHIMFIKSIVGQIAFSIQRGELMNEVEQHTKNLEHIIELRTQELLKTQKTTVFALSKLAETRDPETGGHLDRIRNYSVLLAQILKYTGRYAEITNQYLRDLYDSSILHDIGKVGIPDGILLKKGPLDSEEFRTMRTHTSIGFEALKSASINLGEDSFLKMAMDITLYHHENWNGDGYPNGINGTDIPMAARIVAIVDVYDALTSRRPYKDADSHEKALELMRNESHKYDPDILALFFENSDAFNIIRKQFSYN